MSYAGDSPQVKAAKASGKARRRRARERQERERRHARLKAHPGLPEHPWVCVCEGCEALRPGRWDDDDC